MAQYSTFNKLGQLPADQQRDPSKLSSIIHINDMRQKTGLVRQNSLCVIDHYGDWCGPCKQISNQYENIADTFSRRGVVFCKEDVDKKIGTVGPVPEIRGVPTFLFYINGELQNDLTVVGANIKKVEQTVADVMKGLSGEHPRR